MTDAEKITVTKSPQSKVQRRGSRLSRFAAIRGTPRQNQKLSDAFEIKYSKQAIRDNYLTMLKKDKYQWFTASPIAQTKIKISHSHNMTVSPTSNGQLAVIVESDCKDEMIQVLTYCFKGIKPADMPTPMPMAGGNKYQFMLEESYECDEDIFDIDELPQPEPTGQSTGLMSDNRGLISRNFYIRP